MGFECHHFDRFETDMNLLCPDGGGGKPRSGFIQSIGGSHCVSGHLGSMPTCSALHSCKVAGSRYHGANLLTKLVSTN